MPRVVIVGVGLYGLIAAKTYLQVTKIDYPNNSHGAGTEEVPLPFQASGQLYENETELLMLEAGPKLGGTWAEDRLYPNLLSQNSEGLYEFSDMPLSDAMQDTEDGGQIKQDASTEDQFIPGWKLNRYLTVWSRKWALTPYMRFNWQVTRISRLATKEWELKVNIDSNILDRSRNITIVCDKLILSPGLTSVPNQLKFSPAASQPSSSMENIIHAKDVGCWCRKHLGYQPVPQAHGESQQGGILQPPRIPKVVVIYGGAKSAFDLVHLFATLHLKDPSFHLKGLNAETEHIDPVQVHWVIRDGGSGPAWMSPPQSKLPNGQTVATDKVASTRFVGVLSPCGPVQPKRLCLSRTSNLLGWKLSVEGSWLARLLHGNPIGRFFVRRFWKALDRSWGEYAGYDTTTDDGKMERLRPTNSIIYCGAPLGIANQRGFWDTVRAPNVHTHRSAIETVSGDASSKNCIIIHLSDGTALPSADLLVQATGWKPESGIKFDPPSLGLRMGLSCQVPRNILADGKDNGCLKGIKIGSDIEKLLKYWQTIDLTSTARHRRVFGPNSSPPKDVVPSTIEPTGDFEFTPYRLFRRMVAPQLAEEGDRSFIALGFVLTATTAVVAEVQALWAAAFLTGRLDRKGVNSDSKKSEMNLNRLSRADLDQTISEDVVWGNLTGVGIGVDTLPYNDMLLRDLGLSPYRNGGGILNELTTVYTPKSYRGIVEEWKAKIRDEDL